MGGSVRPRPQRTRRCLWRRFARRPRAGSGPSAELPPVRPPWRRDDRAVRRDGRDHLPVKRLPEPRHMGAAQLKKDAVRTKNIKARRTSRARGIAEEIDRLRPRRDGRASSGRTSSNRASEASPRPECRDRHYRPTEVSRAGGPEVFSFRVPVGRPRRNVSTRRSLTLNAVCTAGPSAQRERDHDREQPIIQLPRLALRRLNYIALTSGPTTSSTSATHPFRLTGEHAWRRRPQRHDCLRQRGRRRCHGHVPRSR